MLIDKEKMPHNEILRRLKTICDYKVIVVTMELERISTISSIEISQLTEFFKELNVPIFENYLGRTCINLWDLHQRIR